MCDLSIAFSSAGSLMPSQKKKLYNKKKVAAKVKRRTTRRLKRQQLPLPPPLDSLPKGPSESRQENGPECSVQDFQQSPASSHSAQRFVTPRVICGAEYIHPSRGNVRQSIQRMEETYEDLSSTPPVPRGTSRVDILQRKIKALTAEKEELQAKLHSTRSKARDKIMRLQTFYRDMYSGNSRSSKILLKSLTKNNV